jgi:hypothetical protein
MDRKEIDHAAIVGYALAKAMMEQLDGGRLRGDAARAALAHLPTKPGDDAPQAEREAWADAEADIKRLGSIG